MKWFEITLSMVKLVNDLDSQLFCRCSKVAYVFVHALGEIELHRVIRARSSK